MKLYDAPGTPNPLRVRLFLAEKGVDVTIIRCDTSKNEHQTPEFLQKNPSGKVPVLELDDGRCLGESVAICRYIEGIYPSPNLFGNDPFELAYIEMRHRQIELELWTQIETSWDNGPLVTRVKPADQIPAAKRASDANVKRYYARLDEEFSVAEYVAGEKFTVADITLLVGINFATSMVDLKPDDAHVNLWRWHTLVSNRPSVRQCLGQ